MFRIFDAMSESGKRTYIFRQHSAMHGIVRQKWNRWAREVWIRVL